MSKRIVIALGGNALGNNPEEQLLAVKSTAKPIVDLIEEGNEVIICHGNGPQVGMINLAMEEASKSNAIIPEIPFPECNAMSQGYIGYHLQNALREELIKRDIKKPVATVITQVIVDKNDTAFQNPTKPIGAFYTKEEAEILEKEKSYVVVEDAGRGYRRVVPSPLPIRIVEEDIIKTLTKASHIVIAVGGGGIPVIEEENSLIGVSAVIDKDFASEKLAEVVEADYLIILTAVEKVALNYGKENEKFLDTISIYEVKQYIKEGHFARGSMLPKVEAAIKFAESKEGRKALITSLEKAKEGIEGKTGTLIV
ncbi:carbamate kinase [Alkaliphilus sp. MSJ-5]|uniref:Carbamate kinase n=1 Tax=Alkaliphilus flagellatus TaxID=2841507 RepID=A0ABS6G657_9FIRM|nr:carbamate kinase [Alkaliphilus flagellatus]MBU5677207.1 carbamate kinase [Alkaliphilus flagellatus]